MFDELKVKIENGIKKITENGVEEKDIEMLGNLIDMHKDISNEEYWDKKKEVMSMRYRDYDEYEGDMYGRRSRDSRGRYKTGRMHEGEEMIEEMRQHYGNYAEGRRYGGTEKEKSFDYMLQSAEEFFTHLMEEAENPEQMEKIKRTARKISEMRV